jgi:hypothetical protein
MVLSFPSPLAQSQAFPGLQVHVIVFLRILGVQRSGFKSRLCHLLAAQPGANALTSPSSIPSSETCHGTPENQMRKCLEALRTGPNTDRNTIVFSRQECIQVLLELFLSHDFSDRYCSLEYLVLWVGLNLML